MTLKTISHGDVQIDVFRATLQSRMIEAALNVRLSEAIGQSVAFVEKVIRGTFITAMSRSVTHGLGALDTLTPDAAFTSEEVAAAFLVFKDIDAGLWDKWDKVLMDTRAPITPAAVQPDAAKKKTSPRKSE